LSSRSYHSNISYDFLALAGIKTRASMIPIPTWDILIATNATQLQITQLFVPFLQQHHLQLGQQQIMTTISKQFFYSWHAWKHLNNTNPIFSHLSQYFF